MYLMELKPTSSCDGKCWFCIDKNNRCKDININKWLNRFNFVSKELEKENLIEEYLISGGEPTYNPQRLQAVLENVSSQRRHPVSIVSNGYRLKECMSFINKFRIDTLFISRHNTCDGGIKNTPSNMELKQLVRASKVKSIVFNCVLQKDTDIKGMVKFSKELGVNRLNFLQLNSQNKDKVLHFKQASKILGRKILEKHGAYFCKCEVVRSGKLEIRFKFASMPRILNSRRDVVNQFTLHPDGQLTSGWAKNQKVILKEIEYEKV